MDNSHTPNHTHSQLGILIPAGIPLEANDTTSSDVKSGRRNLSFSKSTPHGRRGRNTSAESTSCENLELIDLLTTATNPRGGREGVYVVGQECVIHVMKNVTCGHYY